MNSSERVPCNSIYKLHVQNGLNIGTFNCFNLNKDGTRAAQHFSQVGQLQLELRNLHWKFPLLSSCKILYYSASGGYLYLNRILLWLNLRVRRQSVIHLHLSNSVDCGCTSTYLRGKPAPVSSNATDTDVDFSVVAANTTSGSQTHSIYNFTHQDKLRQWSKMRGGG